MKTFNRSGVVFRYPANWTLDVEEDEAAWTATVQGPGTAFLVASFRPDADSPHELAEDALGALKAEYKELDAEPVVDAVGGHPAVGHDIDFLTLDTSTLCLTRAVNTPGGPLLLLAQVSAYDRDESEDVLRAMLASVRVAG